MKPKILVVGFQRSGTTLLRHILSKHPDVKRLLHETRILKKVNTKKQIYKKYSSLSDDLVWGEKVPYFGNNPITYCKKWKMCFDNYRIIHIVRHPFDVIRSNYNTFNIKYNKTINFYYKSVPKGLQIENCLHIKYEDLLLNQKDALKRMFQYCNIEDSEDTIKLIQQAKYRYYPNLNSDRAFSYKNDNFKIEDERIYKVIDTVNKKIPAQKYDWS